MAYGISIKLTHTGLSKSSIFIDDIHEGQDRTSLGRNEGPSYVPYLGSVELVYGALTSISFERGAIRKFIDAGYLTGAFIINASFTIALVGVPVGPHAPSHESGAADTLNGDHLDIGFVPTSYTRDDSIPEANTVRDLAAHLKGIDDALSGGGFGDTRRALLLNRDLAVPTSGVLYLANGQVPLSAAPVVVSTVGLLRGATISVNTPDAVRAFGVRVTLNGVVVETLTLPSGVDNARDNTFTTAFAPGDKIAVYLERTAGPVGPSSFDLTTVLLRIEE